MDHSRLSNSSEPVSYTAPESTVSYLTRNSLNGMDSTSLFQIVEKENSIELVYKQTSMFQSTTYPSKPPEQRIFKIIFSCKDGVWHKSKPIFGKVVPAQEETYKFE